MVIDNPISELRLLAERAPDCGWDGPIFAKVVLRDMPRDGVECCYLARRAAMDIGVKQPPITADDVSVYLSQMADALEDMYP